MNKTFQATSLLRRKTNKFDVNTLSKIQTKVGKIMQDVMGNSIVRNELFQIERRVRNGENDASHTGFFFKTSLPEVERTKSAKKLKRIKYKTGRFVFREMSKYHILDSEGGKLICLKEKHPANSYERNNQRVGNIQVPPKPVSSRSLVDITRLSPKYTPKPMNKNSRRLIQKYKPLFEEK